MFLYLSMSKDKFLRLQYLRMMNSDDFVVEVWRSSIDRFLADMWERTPTSPRSRYLAPIEPEFGFSPDNVEWQFPKIKRKHGPRVGVTTVPSNITSDRPERRLTKAERDLIKREAKEAAREAKRRAIAKEFARWERLRNSG